MKKNWGLFILLLICAQTSAQQLKFSYVLDNPELVYSFRSLNKYEIIDTIDYTVIYDFTVRRDSMFYHNQMRLDIGNQHMNYYSWAERQIDSIYTAKYGESPQNAVNEYSGVEQIIGDRKTMELTCYNRPPFALELVFTYNDHPQFDWELTNKTDTIAGYHCYSAKTHFRGREWNVWFSMDIPENLGPWKFKGLPGLILKVEDEQNLYRWECIGITKKSSPMKRYKWHLVSMTRAKWGKMEQTIYRSPTLYASSQNITLFGIVDGELKRLNETWEQRYNPIELK